MRLLTRRERCVRLVRVIKLSSVWFDDMLEENEMGASEGALGWVCGLRDKISELGITGDGGVGDESTSLASTSRTSNCGAAWVTCRSVCIGIGVKRRG